MSTLMRSLEKQDDQQLLRLFVRESDGLAFNYFVGRHAGLVNSIVGSRIPDSDLAKDVAQQVFILAAKKAGSLLDHPTISGWLSRTAVLKAKKMMRREINRKKREASYSEKIEILDQRFSEEEYDMVQQAIGDLSGEYRSAILLRFQGGKSFEEIGQMMGKTPGAAQRLISRAVSKLRGLVQERSGQAGAGAASFVAFLSICFSPKGSAAELGKSAILTEEFIQEVSRISAGSPGLWGKFSSMMGLKQICLLLAAFLAVVGLFVNHEKSREQDPEQEAANLRESLNLSFGRQVPDERLRILRATRLEGRSLAEKMTDLYLADDGEAVVEIQFRLKGRSAKELEALLEGVGDFPGEGPAVRVLRSLIIDELMAFIPRETTKLALSMRLVVEGAQALSYWAKSEPSQALEWYMEQEAKGEVWERRLWAAHDGSWLGLKRKNGGKGVFTPERVVGGNSSNRKLIDSVTFLTGHLFYGLAEGDFEQALGALAIIPESELDGAYHGISAYCWNHEQHDLFESLIEQIPGKEKRAEVAINYGSFVKSRWSGFNASFSAYYDILKRGGVEEGDLRQAMGRAAMKAAPENQDFVGSWMLDHLLGTTDGMSLFGQVFTAWVAGNVYATADWMERLENDENVNQLALQFVRAAGEGRLRIPKESAEMIASAISDPQLRELAQKAVDTGDFDPNLRPIIPPVVVRYELGDDIHGGVVMEVPQAGQAVPTRDEIAKRQEEYPDLISLDVPEPVELSFSGPSHDGLPPDRADLSEFVQGLLEEYREEREKADVWKGSRLQQTLAGERVSGKLWSLSPRDLRRVVEEIEKDASGKMEFSGEAKVKKEIVSIHFESYFDGDAALLGMRALNIWAQKDSDSAIAWALGRRLQFSPNRNLMTEIALALVDQDIEKAVRVAQATPPQGAGRDPLEVIAGARMDFGSLEKLIKIALEFPQARRQNVLYAAGKGLLYQRGFESAQNFYLGLDDHPLEINMFLLGITASSFDRLSEVKADWLIEVSPDGWETANARNLIRRWMSEDYIAAANWLNARDPGLVKDYGVLQFVHDLRGFAPEMAKEWATVIRDPDVKQKAKNLLTQQ